MGNDLILDLFPDDGAGDSGGSSDSGEGSDGAQDGAGGQSQADTAAAQAAADTTSAELKEARKQAGKYRTERNELQKQLDAVKNAGQSDDEKRTSEITTRDAQIATLTERNRELSVQVLAGKVGIDPDLTDLVVGAVPWDELDSDDPKALEKALKGLAKERPTILADARRQGFDGGAGGRNGSAGSGANVDNQIRALAGMGG